MSKVVVIGGGIAGLVASIKLAEKGHKVFLIEKNENVGGLCSGFFVDGYYVDACLHWLMGTQKGNEINDTWYEVDALNDDIIIKSLPTLGSIEYKGTTVTFYRDLDKAEEEWLKISPKDEDAIHKFFLTVRSVASLMNIAMSKDSIKVKSKDLLSTLPKSLQIYKAMKQSREEYAKNFSSPALRYAITHAQTGYNNIFFFFDLYGIFSMGNADVPEGGAFYMVERMKNRFLELGGSLSLNTTAEEVLVKDEKTYLVKTNNGDFDADYVISAVDPFYTYNKLLKGNYESRRFKKLDLNINNNTISSCFNIYIAVEGDLSNIDVPTGLHIKPIKVGADKTDFMLVRPYHYDSCFIKDGKTVASLFVDQNQNDYMYYNSLSKEEYQKEKVRICKNMIDAFTNRYPEFKEKTHFLTCFGPLELNKQVNTSYGSIQSFSFTDKSSYYIDKGKIKGIDNMFLIGQWTRAIGGTPTALLSACDIIKYIK